MAGTKGGDIVINCSKQGWWNSLEKAVRKFQRNEMHDAIMRELEAICEKILLYAVVMQRLTINGSHQYTGNLINSIVVILFDKLDGVQYDYYAYDSALPGMKPPIRREMSAFTSRGTKRKNAVHFRPADWQGSVDSVYRPEVVTDESYGQDDARAFASSWWPTTGKDFEICVAYTSEYAEWVENEHHTTGIMRSMADAKRTFVHFGLKQIA